MIFTYIWLTQCEGLWAKTHSFINRGDVWSLFRMNSRPFGFFSPIFSRIVRSWNLEYISCRSSLSKLNTYKSSSRFARLVRLLIALQTSDGIPDACIEVSSTSRELAGLLLDFITIPEARRMFVRSDLLSFFRPWRVTGSNQINALMAPPAPKKKAPEKTSQAGGCAVSYLFILE